MEIKHIKNFRTETQGNQRKCIVSAETDQDVLWVIENLKRCLNSDDILGAIIECEEKFQMSYKFKKGKDNDNYIPYNVKCCAFKKGESEQGRVCDVNFIVKIGKQITFGAQVDIEGVTHGCGIFERTAIERTRRDDFMANITTKR